VTDVRVPQLAGGLCLPAPPWLDGLLAEALSVETLGGKEPSDGRLADGPPGQSAVGHESAEDQSGADQGALATDLHQQLSLLGGEGLSPLCSGIAPRP